MLINVLIYYCLTCIILTTLFALRSLFRGAELQLPDHYIERQKNLFRACEGIAHQLNRPWAERLKKMLRVDWQQKYPELRQYLQKMHEADLLRLNLGPAFPLDQRHPWSKEFIAALQRGWEGDKQMLRNYLKKCAELETLGKKVISTFEKPWERTPSPGRPSFRRLKGLWRRFDLWLNSYTIMGEPANVFATQAHPRMRESQKARADSDRRQKSERRSWSQRPFGQNTQNADRRQTERRAEAPPPPLTEKQRILKNGAAHEILGLSPKASRQEVKQAYRDLIKRYHPDKVGSPGSPAYLEAQRLTVILIQAKLEMTRSAAA